MNFQSPVRGDNSNIMPVSEMTNNERANQNRQRTNNADVNRPAMRERESSYDPPSKSPNTFDSTNHEIRN